MSAGHEVNETPVTRLGQPDPNQTGSRAPRRCWPHQSPDRRAHVHLPWDREGPPLTHLRQTGHSLTLPPGRRSHLARSPRRARHRIQRPVQRADPHPLPGQLRHVISVCAILKRDTGITTPRLVFSGSEHNVFHRPDRAGARSPRWLSTVWPARLTSVVLDALACAAYQAAEQVADSGTKDGRALHRVDNVAGR